MSIYKDFKRLPKSDKMIVPLFYLIILIFILFVLYPLIFVFVASFMDPNQLLSTGLSFNFVKDWSLDAYVRVLQDESIVNGFKMSMFYAFSYAAIKTSISITMGYPLSIPGLVGKKIINVLLIVTMFFGGGLIPTFLLVRRLGMLDTIWAILIPGAIWAGDVFLVRTFFRGQPAELREAAVLDGATEFQYFLKIALPLSKSIVAVLFMYAFVGQWNAYFDAMIYIKTQSKQPLQLILRRILIQNSVPEGMISEQQAAAEMARLAAKIKYSTIVIASAPLLIMYPFFQKYFEKGIMIGSLKA